MAPRQIHRLSARTVASIKEPGRHADGGGLYLSVTPDGSGRRWVFLYRRGGRLRELGLGSARDVSLAAARDLAADARRLLATGGDPIAMKRAAVADALTFEECTSRYIEAHKAGWKNAKHASQWQNTLDQYAAPVRHVVWQRRDPMRAYREGYESPFQTSFHPEDFAHAVADYLDRPWLRHPFLDWAIVDAAVSRELCSFGEELKKQWLTGTPLAGPTSEFCSDLIATRFLP